MNISHPQSPALHISINLRKILFWIFCFVLIIYPYLFVINMIFPSTLPWGKNTYISGITGIIFILFLFQWRIIFCRIPLWSLLLIISLASTITLLNFIFYDGVKHLIILFRIPFLLVIYLGVAYSFTRGITEKRIVYNIILCNCVLMAVIGIIHYFYFPYVFTGEQSSGNLYNIYPVGSNGPQAERGILINPNIYSLFLLLGCCLLVCRDKVFKRKRIVEDICLMILIVGIVLSQSRFGLFFSILLALIYIKNTVFKKKIIFIILIIVGVALFSGTIKKLEGRYNARFIAYEEGNIGGHITRLARNQNALALLCDSSLSFLIGPSGKRTEEFKVEERQNYSDNSFLLLAHQYGMPGFMIVTLLMCYLFVKLINIKKVETKIFIAYFLMALFIYNSITFEIWLFFFSVSLMITSRKDDNNFNYLKNIKQIKCSTNGRY